MKRVVLSILVSVMAISVAQAAEKPTQSAEQKKSLSKLHAMGLVAGISYGWQSLQSVPIVYESYCAYATIEKPLNNIIYTLAEQDKVREIFFRNSRIITGQLARVVLLMTMGWRGLYR